VKANPLTVTTPGSGSSKKHAPVSASTAPLSEKQVVFADVKKTSRMLNPPDQMRSTESKNNVTASAIPDSSIDDKELSDRFNKRVITMSSTFCSFGDDDIWIKAFVRELKKDNIINDTADLRFTITPKLFKVNGMEQDESVTLKYSDIYYTYSKKLLTDTSRISLSVSGSSCSLSKTMDE
jgi:hypothetical protein